MQQVFAWPGQPFRAGKPRFFSTLQHAQDRQRGEPLSTNLGRPVSFSQRNLAALRQKPTHDANLKTRGEIIFRSLSVPDHLRLHLSSTGACSFSGSSCDTAWGRLTGGLDWSYPEPVLGGKRLMLYKCVQGFLSFLHAASSTPPWCAHSTPFCCCSRRPAAFEDTSAHVGCPPPNVFFAVWLNTVSFPDCPWPQ